MEDGVIIFLTLRHILQAVNVFSSISLFSEIYFQQSPVNAAGGASSRREPTGAGLLRNGSTVAVGVLAGDPFPGIALDEHSAQVGYIGFGLVR